MRTDRVVQTLVERVLGVVDAEAVVLFGSAARDLARPDSDLDVLVVADCGARRREAVRDLRRQLRSLAVPVDLHLVAPAALDGTGPEADFLRSVAADGRILYLRAESAEDMEKAPQTDGRQRFLDELKSLFSTQQFRSLD
jgi:predicted nucleotidyltransferase